MAITRPDIYKHTNPQNAIVDSNDVRGGGRVVANLAALYALSSNADQLAENITSVWVVTESAYYILTDIAQVTNSAGWAKNEVVIPPSFYLHTQAVPSDTWTITHNLGKRPSIVVVDSGGSECEGDVSYTTDNQLTITFSAGFSGVACCN